MKRPIVPVLLLLVAFCAATVSANPLKAKFDEGTAAFRAGEYKKAIVLFEETLEIYPDFAPSYFYLGLSHMTLGSNIDEVKWLFEKAIESDPDYAMPYEYMCKIEHSTGNYQKAEEYCLTAIKLRPDNIRARLTLAWTYLIGMSQASDAAFYFEEVIAREDIPFAHLGLGVAYFMNDERFKVLEMITDLRFKGYEELAQELEGMLRKNDYRQMKFPGAQRLRIPERQSSTLVRDLPPPNAPPVSTNKTIQNMPVRLSGKMPDADMNKSYANTVSNNSSSNTVSGTERIRAMQRRRMNNTKGSSNWGY